MEFLEIKGSVQQDLKSIDRIEGVALSIILWPDENVVDGCAPMTVNKVL